MHTETDDRVYELGGVCLQLRPDILFSPQLAASGRYYLLEDPLNSRFFRLGHAEYTFVSLLDGRTSIQEAFAQLSVVMPDHCLTETDLAGLCCWLVETELATTAGAPQTEHLLHRPAGQRRARRGWNPLVFRLPLGHLERVFSVLHSLFGWVFAPAAVVAWMGLLVFAAYSVAAEWDRFLASAEGIFEAQNWLWLGAAWAVLKLAHEAAHGIVCKRYGGTVGEGGLLFILFAPLAYVDVTSSWRFSSRWQRVHVAAAGMYIELLIAAIVGIVWSQTDSGWLSHFCFNTVVMASFTTIVFNANPLMKFDGYYMLSDACGLPNLYTNGQACLRRWTKRFMFGIPVAAPPRRALEAVFTAAFGWLSFAWRIFVCAGLLITASTLFEGAGLVLAAAALVMWLAVPAMKFLRYFVYGAPGERPNRVRFLATAASISIACIAVCGFVRWPGECVAPGVVEYAPHTVVRAANPGFVREVFVVDGQQVVAGQQLFRMESHELSSEFQDLKIQLLQSELKVRRHEQRSELAAQQAERENQKSLRKRLAEKQAEVAQLIVRAPVDGQVLSRNLAALFGTYLNQGDELVSIGDDAAKEVRISVSQDDLDAYQAQVGKSIRVDVPNQPIWQARLDKIVPRATLQPPHAALTTVNGGPLSVRSSEAGEDSVSELGYELFRPRFVGVVSIQHERSLQLKSGQRVRVYCRPLDESIGQHLYAVIEGWIRSKVEAG